MSRYLAINCHFPNCCRQIYLSTPNITGVTDIDFSSCIDMSISETTVYFRRNKSSTTFLTSRCCGGVMNVYLDFQENFLSADRASQTSFDTLFTKATTYEVTSNRGVVSEVVNMSYDHWSFTITAILICMTLLIIIGTCLHRRYRKAQLTVEEQFPGNSDCSTREESQKSETSRKRLNNMVADNYFVLEKGDNFHSDLSPTIISTLNDKQKMSGNIISEVMNITCETTEVEYQRAKVQNNISDCEQLSSDVYNTLHVQNNISGCEQLSSDVYNTLHENVVSSNDATNNYSHFRDFSKVYCHLKIDR